MTRIAAAALPPRLRTKLLLPKPAMNATEAEWAGELESLRLAGDVLWFAFAPWKLQLGKGAYYTPDFVVLWFDGSLSCDEVKGFFQEAAKVRIKVAATRYPFLRFRVVKRGAAKGGPRWEIEEVAA